MWRTKIKITQDMQFRYKFVCIFFLKYMEFKLKNMLTVLLLVLNWY